MWKAYLGSVIKQLSMSIGSQVLMSHGGYYSGNRYFVKVYSTHVTLVPGRNVVSAFNMPRW